jgi:hypothetical protein
MTTSTFDCPVLLLIFNRPHTTEKVFERIKQIQPKHLYVAADGPRKDRPGDIENCKATRDVVLDKIDWPCELKTLFHDENLGCGAGPVTAINWFFDNVESGIILEDDCLPALSFFTFCNELLVKYKNDERIMAISGTNLLESYEISPSYLFSILGGNWGWASWRRSWNVYDFNIKRWKDAEVKSRIRTFIGNDNIYNYYAGVFERHLSDTNQDIWDYQWLFCRLFHGGLSIVPKHNQIVNIGFGPDATHTFDANNVIAKLYHQEMCFPLIHPHNVIPESNFDKIVSDRFLKNEPAPNFYIKIKRLVSNIKFSFS